MNDSMIAVRGRGMKREYRLRRIMFALAWSLFVQGETWVDSSRVACLVGSKKTTHFMGLMHELLELGHVQMRALPYRPNQSRYVWQIESDAPFSERWRAAFESEYESFEEEVRPCA